MLSDFHSLIDDALSGATVSAEARDRALSSALATYSADRPRTLIEDVVASGGQTLPLPESWLQLASRLTNIEYPVGEWPASVLDADRYGAYGTPTGDAIGLLEPISAGATVRVTYTSGHVVSDTVDTVPLAHRQALASLAASLLAEQIATRHASDTPVSIAGDSADQSHPAREWSFRAKSLKKTYTDTVAKAPGALAPAGVVVQPVPRRDRLVQRRR
jgi:hypothetical protein